MEEQHYLNVLLEGSSWDLVKAGWVMILDTLVKAWLGNDTPLMRMTQPGSIKMASSVWLPRQCFILQQR